MRPGDEPGHVLKGAVMPEAYSWREGQLHIWTGSATASAVVMYATDTQLNVVWGWANRVRADGSYSDHQTGQMATLSVGAAFTYNDVIEKMALSATAIHAHFFERSFEGSAGRVLYSGRIDSFSYIGADGAPYTYRLAAHFNVWSSY